MIRRSTLWRPSSGFTAWLGLLVGLVSTQSGCLSEPETQEQSLLCESDEVCSERFGSEWRCVAGGCVINVAPSIVGFSLAPSAAPGAGPFFIVADGETRLFAEAQDSDGDSVALRWTPLEAPGDFDTDAVQEGSSIALPAVSDRSGYGTYRYAVVANDGRVDGAAREVSVVLENPTAAIYVSQLGGFDDGCGSIQRPCRTLASGFSAAQGLVTDGGPLRLRLAASPEPYCHNLGLEPGGCAQTEESMPLTESIPIVIEGCFDPLTWNYEPSNRRDCRIDARPTESESGLWLGHLLVGDWTLNDITLAIDAEFSWPEVETGVAVELSRGAVSTETVQSLRDVDVLAPPCGDGCTSIGLSASEALIDFRGVNVESEVRGFDPVLNVAAITLDRSQGCLIGRDLGEQGQRAPEDCVRSATETASAAGERLTTAPDRGVIALNAPASGTAQGVVATDFFGTIEGVAVNGGLGTVITAVSLAGGVQALRGNLIDIVAFGSRAVQGVRVEQCISVCEPGDDNPECQEALRVACVEELDGNVSNPQLVAERNTITLSGGSDFLSSAPCLGVGLQFVGRADTQQVVGNEIELGGQFTLASGMLIRAETSPDEPESGNEMVVLDNRIAAIGANDDPLCVAFNDDAELLPFGSGVVGLGFGGTTRARIADNFIHVGEEVVTDVLNDVTAFGMSLTGAILPESGNLLAERNEVRMGSGALRSIALTTDTSRIALTNNLLYGGDTPDTTGLLVEADADAATLIESQFPVVLFNTVVGGGVLGSTSVSRSVGLESDRVVPPATVGTFVGNALDAGRALGRRFVIENQRFFDSETETFRANSIDIGFSVSDPRPNLGQLSGGTESKSRPLTAFATYVGDFDELQWQTITELGERLAIEPNDDGLSFADEEVIGVNGNVSALRRLRTNEMAVAVAGARTLAVAELGADNDGSGFTLLPYAFDDDVGEVPIEALTVTDLELRNRLGANNRLLLEILVLLEAEEGFEVFAGLYTTQGTFANGFSNLRPVLDGVGAIRKPLGLAVGNDDLLYLLGKETGERDWRVDTLSLVADESSSSFVLRDFATEIDDFRVLVDESQSTATVRRNADLLLMRADGLYRYWPEQGAGVLPCVAEGATIGCGREFTLQSPACAGGLPTSFALTRLNGFAEDDELLVIGCDNARLSAYRAADGPTFGLDASWSIAGLDPDLGAITGLALVPRGTSTKQPQILALVPELDSIVQFEIDLEAPVTVQERGRLFDFSNTAMFDPANGQNSATFEPVTVGVADPDTQCTFAFDSSPSALPGDLRLTGGSCVDPGIGFGTAAPSQDVDRLPRDCQADFGASEVPGRICQ
ncbi:MAG: hypothetical protein AAFP04_05420 [Myxococcota bacterium]